MFGSLLLRPRARLKVSFQTIVFTYDCNELVHVPYKLTHCINGVREHIQTQPCFFDNPLISLVIMLAAVLTHSLPSTSLTKVNLEDTIGAPEK